MAQIPVTAEGKQHLQEELKGLEARVPLVQEQIAEAREKGDLKENAEYHAAREELGMLQGSIAELRTKLANCVLVDESKIDHSKVAFGATLELEDVSDGSVEDWYLVGEGEDDPLENKILTTSPMGNALIGHVVGDVIEVNAPMGTLTFKINSISY